jgi:hypothetical protein
MAVTRSQLLGGPAWVTGTLLNPHAVQFREDTNIQFDQEWDDVLTSLYGKIDQTNKDALVKFDGTPLYYDTAEIAYLWPYIAGVSGSLYPVSSDLTLIVNSTNGDTVTLTSAVITQMPELSLGTTGAVLGKMGVAGIIANSADPSTSANEYYTIVAGGGEPLYTGAPAVASTAGLARQEYTAAWTGITGFTSFQAQDRWTISHELELEPVKIQDRTRAFRFVSYRCMAKCKPIGPTMANIDAALRMQNTGAAGGALLSAGGAVLTITGKSTVTVTINNAGLVSAGFVFGGKPLRQGELGWVSTLQTGSGGTPTAALQLA